MFSEVSSERGVNFSLTYTLRLLQPVESPPAGDYCSTAVASFSNPGATPTSFIQSMAISDNKGKMATVLLNRQTTDLNKWKKAWYIFYFQDIMASIVLTMTNSNKCWTWTLKYCEYKISYLYIFFKKYSLYMKSNNHTSCSAHDSSASL